LANELTAAPRLMDYAPTPPEVDMAWRLHGLASAIKALASGKRLTAAQHLAIDGIINQAESLQ